MSCVCVCAFGFLISKMAGVANLFDSFLICRIVFSCCSSDLFTAPKIRMETKIHPIERENHLPCLDSVLISSGCTDPTMRFLTIDCAEHVLGNRFPITFLQAESRIVKELFSAMGSRVYLYQRL